METQLADTLMKVLNDISPELYGFFIKGVILLIIINMIVNLTKNIAIYVRLRFSDVVSKRSIIQYDGFEGIVDEISLMGIFIKNNDGVVKFIPLGRWNMGDIRYPVQHNSRANK